LEQADFDHCWLLQSTGTAFGVFGEYSWVSFDQQYPGLAPILNDPFSDLAYETNGDEAR
jgi:hypothetical protein